MRYSHLQPNVYMETMLAKKSCHEVALEAIMENNGCVQEANWYHASCCLFPYRSKIILRLYSMFMITVWYSETTLSEEKWCKILSTAFIWTINFR